jgi:DNA helicase-2/ATP-dependent DNA helicase PcrA
VIIDTKEQIDFYTKLQHTTSNIVLSARAGTGKTTSLVKAMSLLSQDGKKLFIAYNKHIVEELKKRLPDDVKVSTCHAIGFAALKRKYGNFDMDEYKMHKIFDKKAAKWRQLKLAEDLNVDWFGRYKTDMITLINLSRSTLSLEKKYIEKLIESYDLNLNYSVDVKRCLEILSTAYEDTSCFDFTDMIYMAAIDPSVYLLKYDYVFVDESQDLSKAQQVIFKKSLKKDTGRFVAVGDPYQSLYGFGGAMVDSFNWFAKQPNTIQLPLTVSFRCAKNIIKHAQTLVPDINAMADAIDGIVREDGDVVEEVQQGDWVLSRKTAPLLKLFFQLLVKNKKATIKGKDIGENLVKQASKYKTIGQLQAGLLNDLENCKTDLLKQKITDYESHPKYQYLLDNKNILTLLCKIVKDIDELKQKINSIFTENTEDTIVLSTVHKSKGLEAERVFIIQPQFLPMPTPIGWQWQQEKNLKYVAITRAKKELIYDYDWTE